LQDKQLTVDILRSLRGNEIPAQPLQKMGRPELSTSFAVGEEAETSLLTARQARLAPSPSPWPLDHRAPRDDVRVDVVVGRARSATFFLGAPSSFRCVLELKPSMKRARLFWSGKIEDDGKARSRRRHFFRSLLIDAHGTTSTSEMLGKSRDVYVHLIPPARDTAHYRLHIPESAGDKDHLHAKLNYRKSCVNTQVRFRWCERFKSRTRRSDSGL